MAPVFVVEWRERKGCHSVPSGFRAAVIDQPHNRIVAFTLCSAKEHRKLLSSLALSRALLGRPHTVVVAVADDIDYVNVRVVWRARPLAVILHLPPARIRQINRSVAEACVAILGSDETVVERVALRLRAAGALRLRTQRQQPVVSIQLTSQA